MFRIRLLPVIFFIAAAAGWAFNADHTDIVMYNGKVITVDADFSIYEAIAIKGDKIIAVGSNEEILNLANRHTLKIDLKDHTVIPGIIDNHVHPIPAALSEYNKKIPTIETLNDLFEWIHKETLEKEPGNWIIHPKFFFTRIEEKRWPTIWELDSIAPDHPVFLNGSYMGMINTKALTASGINGSNDPALVRGKDSDRPTGLIKRSGFSKLSITNAETFWMEEKLEALLALFRKYNAMGITSVGAGSGGPDDLKILNELERKGGLTVRVCQNISFPFDPKLSPEEIEKVLGEFPYKTGQGNEWVKVGALKVVLDGGILTGTAFMGYPWGEKAVKVYGFPDREYRGELNFTRQELKNIIMVANGSGWKFTAHVTGGGGVDTLLAAYKDASLSVPLKGGRHSIIHGNFFSEKAIETMKALHIYADMQPIWFYKDADLLHEVLGESRMAHFQPYRTMMDSAIIVNGGSDHMVKLDPEESINPYNPFLAMWTVIRRKSQGGQVFNPEERVSREQALQMYTINNAYASFEEEIKGSLEVGKLADLSILSKDILTCHEDSIKAIKPVLTMVGGRIVHDDNSLNPTNGRRNR